MNEIQLTPYYVASVSGGKDSLRMLGEIIKRPEMFPLNAIVHFELEIDYPFVKKVCNEYQKIADKLGIPFYRIKPNHTWVELYLKYDMPTRWARWCNSKYKLDCARQLERWQKSLGNKVIYYIGFCADEAKRFKDDENIYPLAILNISEPEILEEAKKIDLFDGYYKHFTRQGCMFCPMISRKELAYIKIYYPNVFERYFECVRAWERKYNSSYYGKQTTDSVLRLIDTKWIPKLLEEIYSETYTECVESMGIDIRRV